MAPAATHTLAILWTGWVLKTKSTQGWEREGVKGMEGTGRGRQWGMDLTKMCCKHV